MSLIPHEKNKPGYVTTWSFPGRRRRRACAKRNKQTPTQTCSWLASKNVFIGRKNSLHHRVISCVKTRHSRIHSGHLHIPPFAWTVSIFVIIASNFISAGIIMCVWLDALNRGDTQESAGNFRIFLHRIRLLACVTVAVECQVVGFFGPRCVPVVVCGVVNVVQILMEVMLFKWGPKETTTHNGINGINNVL